MDKVYHARRSRQKAIPEPLLKKEKAAKRRTIFAERSRIEFGA